MTWNLTCDMDMEISSTSWISMLREVDMKSHEDSIDILYYCVFDITSNQTLSCCSQLTRTNEIKWNHTILLKSFVLTLFKIIKGPMCMRNLFYNYEDTLKINQYISDF